MTYYGTDPWANIATNQRAFYDPTLRAIYRQNTVFTNMVQYATQPMLQGNAQMILTSVFDYETTGLEPLAGLRYNEGAPGYLDSRKQTITFSRFQWQTAMDKSDELINFWNTPDGVRRVINERVGRNLVDTMDKQIRNAFLTTTYMNLPSSSYTGADQVVAADKFTLAMVDEEILRAQSQNAWSPAAPGLEGGTVVCIGTPGQVYDVMTNTSSAWVERQKYASLIPYNNFEIGSYHGSRHFFTNRNILWNCGTPSVSAEVSVAAGPLDGADSTINVDGVYAVGQAASTHYVTLKSGTNMALYSVGDIVTVHKSKNQSAAVTSAPKIRVLGAPRFDEATAVERRVVAKDTGNRRLTFDKPLLVDYSTEVATTGTGVATPSSGCFGFVTKGVNLHINIMLSAPDGILCGVSVPPRFYAPAPIDLFNSVYRFGWDAFWKFQLYKPEAFSVFVTAGSAKIADKLM